MKIAGSLVLLAAAFASVGCIETPPRNLLGGGAGDALNQGGVGGADSSDPTTDEGGAGGSDGSSGPGATTGGGDTDPSGAFTVELGETALESDLMAESVVQITVTPKAGFTGDVELSAFELPDGVTATFSNDSAHLANGAAKTVKLTLLVASDATIGTAPFSVTAHSGALTKSKSGKLKINPSITIHIPKNVLGLGGDQYTPYKTAYGPYPIVISGAGKMITVNFMNDDSVAHEIHSDQTFGHDPGSIPAHTMDSYVRHVPMGQYDFYLHDQMNSGTPGQIVIQ